MFELYSPPVFVVSVGLLGLLGLEELVGLVSYLCLQAFRLSRGVTVQVRGAGFDRYICVCSCFRVHRFLYLIRYFVLVFQLF